MKPEATETKLQGNHLVSEKSPYLQQHAHNPVDWYPWSPAALDKAQRENKPILLSIGYSTCHWCHVMERESFEDAAVAEIMNRHFVCIKVDREERPDLDQIYITAVSALVGSAGWPLNVFLTPELKPFFGGTYFPPTPRPGLIGWTDLLNHIARAWNDAQGRQTILRSADAITASLQKAFAAPPDASAPEADLLDRGYEHFARSFDPAAGGFGSAPKFPTPAIQHFLLAYHRSQRKRPDRSKRAGHALEMATATLAAMSRGGIYDHIGGGFHRYSTDAQWHVPHFEKMLYDNAQLILNFTEAYELTREPMWKEVAEETADYVLRDLAHPEGAFYSAEDADSLPSSSAAVKREGAFYVWTLAEVEELLDADAAAIFTFRYGLAAGGNAAYDPHEEFKGRNILYLARTREAAAQRFNRPVEEIDVVLRQARGRLLQARGGRPRPHLDDKIITSWNGLAIAALARLYRSVGKPAHLQAARRAARFLKRHLFEDSGTRLYRRWRQGERKIDATAEDHAFLCAGLLELFEADFDPVWLGWAVDLTDRFLERFVDARGVLFMTPEDHEPHLPLRARDDTDAALPSAGSVAVANLLRLFRFTEQETYHAAAERLLGASAARMRRHPAAAPQMLAALARSLAEPVDVTIFGDEDDPQTAGLLQAARASSLEGQITLRLKPGADCSELAALLPRAADAPATVGQPCAVVCRKNACRPPVTEVSALMRLLEE